MADVHEGVDTRLRRPVAIKVFRPGPDPLIEDRLAAEAVLLARLQHPGLVTVYDTGRHGDRSYLVMQLVEGPTLRDVLARGTLPHRRVADLGSALAQALAHVHRAGIVHRDVKPSNVLLDAAGEPHLADFGIAELANATRHSSPDVLTGTAAYLAPEQVEGRGVGTPADIYALGLVLLECLKGELEYQGTPLEAAIARLHRPPVIPACLPPDLSSLLRAMTAQDPEVRPDAERCARALAAPDAGRPSHSSPLAATAPVSAHPEADESVRTHKAATARPVLAGTVRHSRRLAAGTAVAALSVALGATLAVAPGSSGDNDDRADSVSTPVRTPSGTATSGSRPSADPSTASRAEPSRTGTSRPAAAPTGSHAEPVSRTLDPSGPAPDRQRGTGPRDSAPHHPRNTNAHTRDTNAHTRKTPHGTPKVPANANKAPHSPVRKGHG
ncbi:protein kinase domain-containing protein [Streptomyces sp. NPDC003719]